MDEKMNELLSHILKQTFNTKYIRVSEIPDIDLYMDQVTTFMEEHLETSKRHEEDKILTKTMINNYAKNDVLPPPQKKKYSKDHIIMLTLIYYFKNFLSISDIQQVLEPLKEVYFDGDEREMTEAYSQIISLVRSEFRPMKEDITKKFTASQATFKNVPADEQEKLRLFAFICLLSFDVYEKKRVIEMLIDEYFSSEDEEKAKKKKK